MCSFFRREATHTGIIRWLKDKVAGKEAVQNEQIFRDPEFQSLLANYYVRELAFEAVANLVANSISKCEFKTFLDGEEVKGKEYYLFNVEPNVNQNSSAFIHKWIHTLYQQNECLIVEVNGQLLVADSFQRKSFALYEDIFTGVTVGSFIFEKTFMGSDVLYFELHQADMRRVCNGIYESYAELIKSGIQTYQKAGGIRATISFDSLAQGDTKFQERMQDFVDNRLKRYMTEKNAVLPLFDGWTLNEQKNSSGTSSNNNTRDIRSMIDDIFDFTAKAFSVPAALVRGEATDLQSVLDLFLTFCIDPLVDMLQEEINRKRVGYAGFAKGTRVVIDTKAIRHADLLSVSTAIDKLISSGAFCINDIRVLVGEQPIDEPWAWQHWMTKNYSTMQELLAEMQGGGADAE